MLFASTELAARIERAECRLVRDSADAVRRRAAADVFIFPIAGGVATFTGEGSPLNKVAGLGFDGPVEESELERIERAYAERGSPVHVELSCLAEPSIGALLTRRGYVLQNFENVLGRTLPLVVNRGGERLEFPIAAEPIPTDDGAGIAVERYRIGIRGSEALVVGAIATDLERNPLVSIPRGVGMTVDFTRVFLVGLAKIVSGEVSSRSLAGPIGIAQIAGSAFQQGWEPYLRIMILISINLGILNLLPIPVLDGGQAVLFTVESLKRGPLSLRTKLAVQQVGVTVLFLLMGLAFWNDLTRIWSAVVDWLPRGL